MSSRVVLQHQSRLFREALAGRLTNDERIADTMTVATGPELIRACASQRPDIVVLEADMPRWHIGRVVALVRRTAGGPRVIGVHDALPFAQILRAYDAGVSALLPYARGLDALLDAITAPLLPVELARAEGHPLSDRELRVLYLSSAGIRTEHIAHELGISTHAVEHDKQRIFTALSRPTEQLAPHPPRPEPGPRRRHRPQVGVVLRDPTGPLADRIRGILVRQGISVFDDPLAAGHEELVTVVVDPKPEDWPAPDAAGDKVIVVTSRTPARPDLLSTMARRASTVPAAHLEGLLVPAVRAVVRGYLVADAEGVLPGAAERWEVALTPRERQILASISRGHATKQTARLLGISAKTVENLQGNLYRKLKVRNKAAALAAAHNLGLLQHDSVH